MLYDIQEGTDGAYFKCNKCSYTEALTSDNPIVYDHSMKTDNTSAISINPYLRFDPTLEHLKTVVCINEKCPSHKGAEPDVVAIEVNSSKLVWMYQCTNCYETWSQSARKSDDS